MPGIRVQDGDPERGGLAFDLAEILTALGRSALESCWRPRGVTYVADEDVALLEVAEAGTRVVSGAELLVASRQLLQVIQGEFCASRKPDAPPWLVVRAVDSSWWEVWTEDPNALAAVRAAFRVVEQIAG